MGFCQSDIFYLGKTRLPRAGVGQTPPAGRRKRRRRYVGHKDLASGGEDVLVIGHGVHVLKRFADPRRGAGVRRSARRDQSRGAAPEAQAAPENLLHDLLLVNHGDDTHRVLAPGADQRIGVPALQDEVARFLGRRLVRRRRN